jgi:hypothetical protein
MYLGRWWAYNERKSEIMKGKKTIIVLLYEIVSTEKSSSLSTAKNFFFFNTNEYGSLFRIRQRGLPNPYISVQSYSSVIHFPAR